jgi:hypothetical protein
MEKGLLTENTLDHSYFLNVFLFSSCSHTFGKELFTFRITLSFYKIWFTMSSPLYCTSQQRTGQVWWWVTDHGYFTSNTFDSIYIPSGMESFRDISVKLDF